MCLAEIKSIEDVDVSGKRVLVRVDFNVPLTAQGEVADDFRIRAALPTLKYLVEHDAKIIIVSHMGRPKGKYLANLTLDSVARRLEALLNKEVTKLDDCIGPEVERVVKDLKPGQIVLLENVRFHPEEERNDPEFARALASLADIFVNDAFSASHRTHASTAGVAKYLPAVSGLLMKREVDILSKALDSPARPFVAILGGVKISDKLGIVRNLLQKVDSMLVGGAMASTFLKSSGLSVGASLVETEMLEVAQEIVEKAASSGKKLLLPKDVIVASKIDADAAVQTVTVEAVPSDWYIVDIGPRTCAEFRDVILTAGTILWNGPMGVFEIPKFSKGTESVARAMAETKAVTIAGGGDSLAALRMFGLEDALTHVSTGGGATLEFLEGKELPGIKCLETLN